MSNPFFENTIDLLPATKAKAGDVEANLNAVEAGFDEAKEYFDRTLRGARANPAIAELPNAATRANKALTFDASGNPVTTVTTTEISNAQTYATNAQNSATAAAGSASDAAASYDSFDDRYLGPKASDPTLDNDGNALLEGALYWNTTAKEMRAWNGTAWVAAIVANAVSRLGDTMTGNLTVPSLNTGQLAGLRNKIINGNFGINQRNYVSGAATSAGQYTLDRWKVTGTGGVTFSTTANKTTVTIPSGQTLQQVIEGLNLESGTYVLSWEGTAQGRIAGGSYGASGAVTASITGGTNTTIEFNTGTVALVMLEKGTVATPFEYRSYTVELALCHRYYYRFTPGGTAAFYGPGFNTSSTAAIIYNPFPVPMRTRPTALEQSGTASHYRVLISGSFVISASVPLYGSLTTNIAASTQFDASGISANGASIGCSDASGNGYLGWSAEL